MCGFWIGLGRTFRSDRSFRGELEDWTRQLWTEKDSQIALLGGSAIPDQTVEK